MDFSLSTEDIPDESQGVPAAFLGDRGLRYQRVSTIDMVYFEKSSFMTKKQLEFIIKAIVMA